MDKGLYQQIKEMVNGIELIDTHEHIIPEWQRISMPVDAFTLVSFYTTLDLISAGMPPEQAEMLQSPDVPLEKKWKMFVPFWEEIRFTGYGQSVIIGMRDLYEIDDFNKNTYRELSERVTKKNKKGLYHEIMKKRAKIDLAILNILESRTKEQLDKVDRSIFAPVARDTLQKFTILYNRPGLDVIEKENNIAVHSLKDLVTAMEIAFEKAIKAGVVGIKNAAAYNRIIYWEKVTVHDAEIAFNKLFSHPVEAVSMIDAKPLQDYMFHQIIQRALAEGLPIQIHSGIHARNECMVTDSKPTYLINLFLEYRDAKFDIFHAGYPYVSELATIAKNFPNVYIDLCWVPLISPTVAKHALHEWLETIPVNKIFAFGGDCIHVEGAYAHSVMVRDVVAQVLTKRIENGYIDEKQAETIAKKILNENAYKFFKLEKYKKKYLKEC